MKQEQLKPNLSIPQLQERLKDLIVILKRLKTNPSPQVAGRLRISQKGKYTEYYHIKDDSNANGKYIPKKQQATAIQLAQKDYNSKIITLLEEEIEALRTYLNTAPNIQAFYSQMCPARQSLITPLTLTDEQYATQWKNVTWQGLPFAPDASVYTTNQGERVRSKSEVLIANALAHQKIPYRYEYPLHLKNGNTNVTYYPDFTCLNVHTRQEFIWEHFGLMDNEDYRNNAISKLAKYSEAGFVPGRNFIYTMETSVRPLSSRLVKQLIEAHFL